MKIDVTNAPLVSVVMAVRNGDAYLRESVESILGQTYWNFEFIIIDDGSTDESPCLLADFARGDKRICIVTQENAGLTESLNRGMQKARGKYIARMDADDISMPDRFALQVSWLEAHPEVAVLGGQARFFTGDGTSYQESCFPRSFRNQPRLERILYAGASVRHVQKGCCSSARRLPTLFTTAQDYDLWLRVANVPGLPISRTCYWTIVFMMINFP
jgi:glycosyltransferase involved in cell wall biosynthesis